MSSDSGSRDGTGKERAYTGRQRPRGRGADADSAAPTYTRREIIQRVAYTSVASAATIGGGVWLLGRGSAVVPPPATIADHRVTRPAGSTAMAIARGKDPQANVRKALQALGGIEAFVRPGDRVVIKPNVGWNRLPQQAANSNPDVVAEVVRLVVAAGAASVWVTDVPVNNPERCFTRSGIGEAARAAGAEVVLPSKNGYRQVNGGGRVIRIAEVLWPFVNANKVINVPIVKQHGSAGATMALKNWYGVIGGHRARLHQDLDRSIVELAAMVKPTLTVMDATRVLLANGPSGGSLDDVKRLDTVVAGTDEVALDAFGATLLGRRSQDLGFIGMAEEAGLGRSDYRNMKVAEVTG